MRVRSEVDGLDSVREGHPEPRLLGDEELWKSRGDGIAKFLKFVPLFNQFSVVEVDERTT